MTNFILYRCGKGWKSKTNKQLETPLSEISWWKKTHAYNFEKNNGSCQPDTDFDYDKKSYIISTLYKTPYVYMEVKSQNVNCTQCGLRRQRQQRRCSSQII